MSAARHIHPGQLSMFLPAETLQTYEPNPMDYAAHERRQDNKEDLYAEHGETYERVPFWDAKRAEAQGSGLAGKVAESGVKRPVNVFHTEEGGTTIAHGHHRAASPPGTLVPVRHYGEPHHSFITAMWEHQDEYND